MNAHCALHGIVCKRPKRSHVDFCERVRGTGTADEELAKRVQLLEWKLLFNWCLA